MTGIHHTAIVTTDVERSMRFWCDGLGFTELFDHTFTGDWPTLFNARTDRLRSIFLGDPNAPDTGLVELVQFGRGREERDVIGVVVWGTLIGSLLPLVLRRLGFDPATSSAPFVATLVDVTGLIIYFSVALVVLRGTLL